MNRHTRSSLFCIVLGFPCFIIHPHPGDRARRLRGGHLSTRPARLVGRRRPFFLPLTSIAAVGGERCAVARPGGEPLAQGRTDIPRVYYEGPKWCRHHRQHDHYTSVFSNKDAALLYVPVQDLRRAEWLYWYCRDFFRSFFMPIMWARSYLIHIKSCLLYTSPSPRDKRQSRMPSSA